MDYDIFHFVFLFNDKKKTELNVPSNFHFSEKSLKTE